MDTYALHEHAWMLGQTVRTSSYVDALRRVLKPGDIVLDIGTGVGTWAVAACRLGAGRVYAVDPSDVIKVGRELAAANGCADRIEFIQGSSNDLTLPQRADIIVQEIHGVLPMQGGSLATVIDARQRLLAPGGTLIPKHETLWAALVNAADLYAPHDRPWGASNHGWVLDPVREALTNYWLKRTVRTASLVEAPQAWATLDYMTLESPHVRGSVEWTITRPATVHGLALWFDAVLTDDIGFSNAPDLPGLPFGQAFFPWKQPIALKAGDTARVDLVARLLEGDYLWYWAITVTDAAGTTTVRYQQSDFWQDAISPQVIHRSEAGYVPRPNEDRRIDALILEGLEQDDTTSTIASRVFAQFPHRFDDASARDRVVTLAGAYGLESEAKTR